MNRNEYNCSILELHNNYKHKNTFSFFLSIQMLLFYWFIGGIIWILPFRDVLITTKLFNLKIKRKKHNKLLVLIVSIHLLLLLHTLRLMWKRFSIGNYRNLLASRSDSNKVRISPSRTGPFTFLMMERVASFKNSTFTCVHCPWDPVRPSTLITRAKMTGLSIFNYFLVGNVWFCDEGLHKKTVFTNKIQNDSMTGHTIIYYFNLWLLRTYTQKLVHLFHPFTQN